MKVILSPQWAIAPPNGNNDPVDATLLIQLLSRIETEGSIAAAGRIMNMSYRHAWGILRDAEIFFGSKLIVKRPGKGTDLSELANVLIQADRRFSARLAPTLESLASELEAELRKVLPFKREAIRLFASHGFAVETLLALIKKEGALIEVRYRNSSEALAALANNECQLAGFHVPIGEFEEPVLKQYQKWLTPDYALIQVATRRQGLFIARGNPHGINGLKDLARKDIRFVNRQAGSGTRMLVEMMLQRCHICPQDIHGFETAEFTHAAVAAYIASGMAEVGFGVETAAQRFNLHFIPLAIERYFFATKALNLDLAGIEQLIALMKSDAFRQSAKALEGYDASEAGNVLTVHAAFNEA